MESPKKHPATQHPPTIGRLRKTRVKIHPMTPVPAYISRDRWNGAVVPYFTPQQAEDFAREFEEAFPDSTAEYDEERDAWVIDSPERAEPEVFPSVERCGQTFYAIGAWCWVWVEETTLDEIHR